MSKLTELEANIYAVKLMGYKKVEHEGVWIGIGYANFLVRLYRSRQKYGVTKK